MSTTITITTTSSILCNCGKTIVVNCSKCDLLEADIVQLKADNVQLKADVVQLKADVVQLKADVVQLKADVVQLKAYITETEISAKTRQIAIDIMQVYINKFANMFDYERIEAFEIHSLRRLIDRTILREFDNDFFQNKCTFIKFYDTLKNMKNFNEFAHPKYDIDEVYEILENHVKNGSELVSNIVSNYISDFIDIIKNKN